MYCVVPVDTIRSVRSLSLTTQSRAMKDNGSSQIRKLASLLGASGVVLGALGAHSLQDRLAKRGVVESWRTAVLYQLFHAAALLGISALCASHDSEKYGTPGQLVRSAELMTAGTCLFSGSIYLLCFGIGPRAVLGPSTPLGGLLMVSGWVMLGLNAN